MRRRTKLIGVAGIVVAVAVAGVATTHYVADRRIRREIAAAQAALPPGDALSYTHLSTGLLGRTLTFDGVRIKHGPQLGAADRLVLRGLGRRSAAGVEARNLRLAEDGNALTAANLSLRDLRLPKDPGQMTRADWPHVALAHGDARDVHIGLMPASPGAPNVPATGMAIAFANLAVDHLGGPRGDRVSFADLAVKGAPSAIGELRIHNWTVDGADLGGMADWIGRGANPSDFSSVSWRRHDGLTEIEGLKVGPEAAPNLSLRHLHAQSATTPAGLLRSVLDLQDWRSQAPAVLAFLTSLGYTDTRFLGMDLTLATDYDPRAEALTIKPLKVDLAGMGALTLAANLGHWPSLAAMPAPASVLAAQLAHLALTYHDQSLFGHLVGYLARQRGVSAGQVQAGLAQAAERLAASHVPSVAETGRALTAFVGNPGTLEIGVQPPQPVTLSMLALALANPEGALQALNVSVKAR